MSFTDSKNGKRQSEEDTYVTKTRKEYLTQYVCQAELYASTEPYCLCMLRLKI